MYWRRVLQRAFERVRISSWPFLLSTDRNVRHRAAPAFHDAHPVRDTSRKRGPLQVLVRDNNVDQALKVLKKKMQREGIFREMKQRRSYEKPSERRVREQAEAVRRARKLARKEAVREGLLPPPKPRVARTGTRPGMTALSASPTAARETTPVRS
jgi:small subunit ribosomal protein S21